jgi:hypothetical protein
VTCVRGEAQGGIARLAAFEPDGTAPGRTAPGGVRA